MPIRGYLIGITTGTLLTLAAFLLVLFYFDPQSVGSIGISLFFLSLVCSLSGVLTLGLFAIFKKFQEDQVKAFYSALRGGVLLGCLATGIMVLASLSLLAWWNLLLITLAIFLVEVYFRIKT